jgi:hypothetical protein
MGKKALCFLVLGASLSVLLQNLAKRRSLAPPRPVTRKGPGEVIDLAAWRELKNRNQLAVSAK